jgi:hypothetical protein
MRWCRNWIPLVSLRLIKLVRSQIIRGDFYMVRLRIVALLLLIKLILIII